MPVWHLHASDIPSQVESSSSQAQAGHGHRVGSGWPRAPGTPGVEALGTLTRKYLITGGFEGPKPDLKVLKLHNRFFLFL